MVEAAFEPGDSKQEPVAAGRNTRRSNHGIQSLYSASARFVLFVSARRQARRPNAFCHRNSAVRFLASGPPSGSLRYALSALSRLSAFLLPSGSPTFLAWGPPSG